jgi:hypothetical protein
MCSRLLKALCYLFGAIVISIMILFISWAFFKFVDLPYTEVALDVSNVGTAKITTPTVTNTSVTL